jgi:hypothetical protein
MLQSADLQNLAIVGHREEGLFNLQIVHFCVILKFMKRKGFLQGPLVILPAPLAADTGCLEKFSTTLRAHDSSMSYPLHCEPKQGPFFPSPATPLFAERSSPHCSQLPPSVALCSAIPPHCLHHFSLLLLLFALPCRCCCGLTVAPPSRHSRVERSSTVRRDANAPSSPCRCPPRAPMR